MEFLVSFSYYKLDFSVVELYNVLQLWIFYSKVKISLTISSVSEKLKIMQNTVSKYFWKTFFLNTVRKYFLTPKFLLIQYDLARVTEDSLTEMDVWQIQKFLEMPQIHHVTLFDLNVGLSVIYCEIV